MKRVETKTNWKWFCGERYRVMVGKVGFLKKYTLIEN